MGIDYGFMSVKVIIDRIMERELFKTLKLDSVIRWTKDCLSFINNPNVLSDKIEIINIDSYRGRLPYDFIGCIKVELVELSGNTINRYPARTSSDPFFPQQSGQINQNKQFDELVYRVEGNNVFTDIEQGTIQMAYRALPVDFDGYIMIPSNVNVVAAVESYIKYKHLEILNDIGQVGNDKVAKEEQAYCWYVAKAQSEHFLNNLDKAQAMINTQSQFYPSRNEHRFGYTGVGTREHRL